MKINDPKATARDAADRFAAAYDSETPRRVGKTKTMNGPEFADYAAALDYYRQYKSHCYTSRLHGGQTENFMKLRAWVNYKIANGEIRLLKQPPANTLETPAAS